LNCAKSFVVFYVTDTGIVMSTLVCYRGTKTHFVKDQIEG